MIGQRPGKNPLWGKPFQIILPIQLSSNDSKKYSKMIHIFISTTIHEKKLQHP